MKVLVVSFFNDESYGVRSLHATLVDNNIDAYMMFFKLEAKYYEKLFGYDSAYDVRSHLSFKEVVEILNEKISDDDLRDDILDSINPAKNDKSKLSISWLELHKDYVKNGELYN